MITVPKEWAEARAKAKTREQARAKDGDKQAMWDTEIGDKIGASRTDNGEIGMGGMDGSQMGHRAA